jgi:L-fuconolactonase
MRIDAHQHFWKYKKQTHVWIDETMVSIQKDFLPEDLKPHLLTHNIIGCVAVQTAQTELETEFLLNLAEKNSMIKGVVGWVNLQSKLIEMQLEKYAENTNLKGFRHILQAESADFMLQQSFIRGLKALEKHKFTYDILIYPEQLPFALKIAKQCESQYFVLDHFAKPSIKTGAIKQWEKDLRKLAKMDHVFCKISGLITEANWQNWTLETLRPYLDVAFESFGPDRLMFGSDWPVCLLAGQYTEVIHAIESYIESFSASEKAKIMGENAIRFYKLSEFF